MPKASITYSVTMTETWHFRRLVDFLVDVETHARENDDYALLSIVDEVQDDLRKRQAGS